MPQDRLPEIRRRAHLRQALLGVHLEHQSRGEPAVASAAARSRGAGRGEPRALRRTRAALLPGRRVRIRRRRKAAPASACRSTRRTACTARPATSRIRARTSTGSRRRAAAGRTTRTCDAPRSVHSHAAPRTPLESPCRCRTSRVSTRSENTHRPHSVGTFTYSDSTFDMPPPSTMTSGSSRLMTCASARARRSLVAQHRRTAAVLRPCARQAISCAAALLASDRPMIALQPRSGQEGLDATMLAAKTQRAGTLVVVRPRQRIVAPFACDRVWSAQHSPRTTMPASPRRCRGSRRTRRSAPRPAPSIASDSAKQLASLVMRTSRPSSASRSALIGLPLRQTELDPRKSPVAATANPGVPMPTLPRLPECVFASRAPAPAICRSVAPIVVLRRGHAPAQHFAAGSSSATISVLVPPRSMPKRVKVRLRVKVACRLPRQSTTG